MVQYIFHLLKMENHTQRACKIFCSSLQTSLTSLNYT